MTSWALRRSPNRPQTPIFFKLNPFHWINNAQLATIFSFNIHHLCRSHHLQEYLFLTKRFLYYFVTEYVISLLFCVCVNPYIIYVGVIGGKYRRYNNDHINYRSTMIISAGQKHWLAQHIDYFGSTFLRIGLTPTQKFSIWTLEEHGLVPTWLLDPIPKDRFDGPATILDRLMWCSFTVVGANIWILERPIDRG